MRIIFLTALAIITVGCGSGGQPAQNQPVVAQAGNIIGRMDALSDRQRNGVFIRAIRDAGLECQHVDWSTRSGTYRGMPVWTAACAGNQLWVIVVGADGNAQVLNPTEGLWIYNRMDGNGQ